MAGNKIAVFLRHADYEQQADTPSAHQPFSLNEKGKEQAAAAVPRIKELARELDLRWHPVIISSPSLRAWQTADIIRREISDEVDFEIEEDSGLMERGLGSGANLTIDELEAVVSSDPRCAPLPTNWKSDSDFRLPLHGAESLMDAGRRVADCLEHSLAGIGEVAKDSEVNALLFVGHGASFRHAAHHLGVLERDDIARYSMYHARPVALEMNGGGDWRHLAGEWKRRVTKLARSLD
jgi:2,3-bisphosphoglycerate-dependent phosphoglycerate mutase